MAEKEGKSEKVQYLNLTVQSLSLFLISYYLLYLISGLSVLYISYDFDIPARLYINKLHFDLPDDSPLWTTDAIISILMVTPVSSFVLGILIIFIFMIAQQRKTWMLFISIWLFLQAFNLTFGLLIENLITQTGLVKVAREMKIKSPMMILTVGISVFLLIKSGIFAAKFLYSHLEEHLVATKRTRKITALYFFFIPWLIGSGIILSFTGNSLEIKDLMLTGFMLVLLLPSFFVNSPEIRKSFIFNNKVTIILVLVAISISFAFYNILKDGISF
ncbi:MAG: hypothetical protein CVT92_09170 [Bacteroidetes bacterium HGW-Bacteroidetes-1]|jgi:hypothetical protein|nr:MAG: hypothetical protein CVT92_09170 [Bacteroidetes bacterium HGW-Bacteroidetes-1]